MFFRSQILSAVAWGNLMIFSVCHVTMKNRVGARVFPFKGCTDVWAQSEEQPKHTVHTTQYGTGARATWL